MVRSGIGRAAASAALLLTAFTSFGAALLVDATSAHALAACTDSWTGNGANDNWATAGNWSGNNPPSSADVACIGDEASGSSFSVAITTTESAAALELGGTTASTLTVTNSQLTLGNASLDQSEILSNGILDVNAMGGNAQVYNSSDSGLPAFTVAAGGQLDTSGTNTAYLGEYGSIVNNGTMDLDAPVTNLYNAVVTTNNNVLDVGSTDTVNAISTSFTNASAGTIGNSGTFVSNQDFIERGSTTGNAITIDGGTFDDDTSAGTGAFTFTTTSTLTGTGSSPGIATGQLVTVQNAQVTAPVNLTDDGTVDVAAAGGNAELYDGNTGPAFTVAAGGQLDTSGTNTAYLGEYGSIVNNGTMDLDAPVTNLYNAVVTTNNNVLDVGSTDTVNAISTSFTNASAGTIGNSGTFVSNQDFIERGSTTGNAITIDGGTFDDDTSAGTGAFTFTTTSTLTGTGSSPGIATGQLVTVQNAQVTAPVNLTDDGTVDVAAAGGNAELYDGNTGPAFTVAAGGQLDTSGTNTAYLGEYGSIVNNGTMDLDAPVTNLYNAVVTTNNNVLDVGSTDTVNAISTSFTNASAGTIGNSGTFVSNQDFIERGSTTGNAITIDGGTFDDDTSAGTGAFTFTTTSTLTGTGSSPGIATGQLVTVQNAQVTAPVNLTDDGTVDVAAAGGNAELYDGNTGPAFTVAAGGQLDTSGTNTAYLGEYGSIVNNGTMDLDAPLTNLSNAAMVTNNGTMTVADGSTAAVNDSFTQSNTGTTAVTNDVTASTSSQITGGVRALSGTLDVTTDGTPTGPYSPFVSASSQTGVFGTLNYHGTNYATGYSSSAVTLTPSLSGYGLAGLKLSSTSTGASGVSYTLDLQGQAVTAGSTTFTVTAPAGTTFPAYSSNCYAVTVEDVTTSTTDTCLAATPVTSNGGRTLTFTSPLSIPASDHAQIEILNVTNTGPAASESLTLSNGSSSVQLGYILTPSTSVGGATISASSTSDQASNVAYTTTFTATNGLTGPAGQSDFSTITLTLPSTYTAPTYSSNCGSVVIDDLTTNTSENCTQATPSTSGNAITYGVPIPIAAGDQVKVVWYGLTNPSSATGAQTFTLVTSGDPTPVDLTVNLTAPTSVTNGTLVASSTSDGANEVAYTSTFKSVNELVGGYSSIALTLPPGVTAPSYSSNCDAVDIVDETTSASATCSAAAPVVSGQSIVYAVPAGVTISPGDTVQLVWYGVTNPASNTGSQTFQLSTSADPKPEDVAASLTAPTAVTGLTVSPNSATAGATGVTYTATFTTKNGLIADSGENSTIAVTFPTGTGLSFSSDCNGITIDDLTTSTTANCTSATPTLSNSNLTVSYLVPFSIAAGNQIELQITGVTNPTATSCTGSQSASLVTSGDPATASASYAIASDPGAPSLTSAIAGDAQVVLDWSAPSCSNGSAVVSYTILRGLSTGTETVLHTGVTGGTYTDTTAANGTPYFYEVEAVNGVGTGAVSNEESATPEPLPENTTTTLNAVTTPVTYGSEGSETFSGTVTGQSNDGYPEGTVTVTSGETTLCSESLPTGSGDSSAFSCSLTATQLAAGTYSNVVAVYTAGASSNTDFIYNTSSSTPAQSITISPQSEGTATTLNAVESPVDYGSEANENFTGTVTGESGDGYPEGTVTVMSGATTLCSETLPASSGDSASFSCSLTATQLTAGPYASVTAIFTPGGTPSSNPDFAYTTSSSTPAQSFAVDAESEGTTTALNTVTSPVTYGAETAETFSGTVTGQTGDGYPEGTVTVYDGSTPTELCSATLTGGSGDGASFSCSLTASQLGVGGYSSVDAVYSAGSSSNGDFTYGTSTSTPVQSFTVETGSATAENTATTLNALTTPITYGAETAETFSGTVTGQTGDGYPEGTVTVYDGSTPTEICAAALSGGSGDSASFSCSLTASQLDIGSYTTVDAVYTAGSSSNSSFTYNASTSTPAQSFTVNVESAGTTTSLNTVTSPTTYGAETSETFTGTVTGQTGDGYPEGTVTLYEGSTPTQLCSETLPAGTGDSAGFSCSLSATELGVGGYSSVDAVFTPSGTPSSNPDFTYTTSTSSPVQSFTVNAESEGTTTTLDTVTSPITYGAETSETFSGTVTGQTGDGYPEGTVSLYEGATPVQLCAETLPAGSGDSASYSCSLTAAQLGAGGYASVDAVFTAGGIPSSNADFTYTTSTSTPAQNFSVNAESEGTTAMLNTVASPVTYGSETSETFGGTVTGQTGDGYPEGTVTVQSGTTVLCSETLPTGSGDSASFSCSPSNGSVLAASSTPYSVTATFTPAGTSSSNPDFTYTTSTSSPPQSLTVNASTSTEGTTTTLNAVTSPIRYGAETAATFSGTVTGQTGDGYPEGTVTVYEGSTPVQLCAETLPAGSGDSASYSCSLTATQLGVGGYSSVNAVFSPGGTSSSSATFIYTTSTSTPAQSFTVNAAPEATTTTLNTITSPVTVGSETSETFSGTVTGQSGDGDPLGTLTVQTGATVVCSETLASGTGDSANYSCNPSNGSVLAASSTPYPVAATFTPAATSSSNADFGYTTSTSTPAQNLTVNAATSTASTTTTLNTVTSPITYGAETAETFSGTVTGQTGDGYPKGTVSLYEGATPVQLCAETLPAGSGDSASYSCSLTAAQLVAGSYSSVDAVFSPGAPSSSSPTVTYTTSTSTPVTSFTVKAETESTTTTLNAVTSPITVGSETAETFSGTVTGQTGDGYPEGTVTVYEGSTPTALCSEALPAGTGDSAGYSCSLTASQLGTGTYSSVDAVFAPGGTSSSNASITYTTSTSTPTQSFTVNPVATSANNLQLQISSPGLISGIGGLYLLAVANHASTSSSGTLTITDMLPAGLSYAGVLSYPQGWKCTSSAGTVTCTSSAAIPARGVDDLLLAVNVSARAGTSITNKVTLTPVGTPASNYTSSVTAKVVAW